jgi:hypothetical protein
MNSELIAQLQAAQQELDPQLKALNSASSALKSAINLARDERGEALTMQKALAKLQQSAAQVDSETMRAATNSFEAETQRALDALAFEFARDLRQSFEERGISLTGRPPTLVVEPFVLQMDTGARKAQWFYGKEALTRPLPLSLSAIMKAYDQQRRAIGERQIDVDGFLGELYRAWNELLQTRTRRPTGGRIPIIETYSKLVLNRQSARFWNQPSRSVFKDYERAFFVRDLVLAQASPTLNVDGTRQHLRLGVATKSQADNPSRSLWLPRGALDGEYYSDLTFEEA